jgi:hypothetical protein
VVPAGKKVVAVMVKRAVAVTTGRVGKLGREDGLVKAAGEAELVIGVGKAVVGVLVGKVMKGDSHYRVSEGGKFSADIGRGGGVGGQEVIVGLLEAAVAAEVGKAEGAVGEIIERRRGGRFGKGRVKAGGTSRTEQSALTTGVGLPGRKDGLAGRRKVSNAAMPWVSRKMERANGITKEPVVAKSGSDRPGHQDQREIGGGCKRREEAWNRRGFEEFKGCGGKTRRGPEAGVKGVGK